VILEVGASASAKQIFALTTTYLSHIDGSFTDLTKIRELAAKVDVLTVEIEPHRRGRVRRGAASTYGRDGGRSTPGAVDGRRSVLFRMSSSKKCTYNPTYSPLRPSSRSSNCPFKSSNKQPRASACRSCSEARRWPTTGAEISSFAIYRMSRSLTGHFKVNEMVDTLSSTHTLCSSAKGASLDNVS
jgi:hypothetical protein